MKIKILAALIMLLVVSSTISLASATGTCGTPDPLIGNSLKTVEVEKKIKSANSWVDEIEANIGDMLRFRIKVTYHDTDGDGIGYELKNITMVDRLPLGLKYIGNATQHEDDISDDGRNITWVLSDILYDGNSSSIEFNVKVINAGEFVNVVNVSAIESCYGAQRWGEASAKVSANGHDNTPPSVEITKPKKKWLYRDDREIRPIFLRTRIIGPITIEVNASDESGIQKVEFYINGKLKGNDTTAPYKWTWDGKTFFVGIQKIKVVVYDKAGNKNSDERSILKMPDFNFIRNHPGITLGVIVGAGLIVNKLRGGKETTGPENMTPKADAGGPYAGYVNQSITFDGSGSTDDGTIVYYKWDFGDGTTMIDMSPTHTYTKTGNYTVKLTVFDDEGKNDTDTTYANVSAQATDNGEKNKTPGFETIFVIISLTLILLWRKHKL